MTLLEAKQSLAPYRVLLFIHETTKRYMVVSTINNKRYVTADLTDAVMTGIELHYK